MVLGLALAFFGNQATTEATRASRHGTWLIALAVLEYSSLYVLTWTLVRYRLPVDALLMPFAGFALADLSARLFNVRHTAGAGAVASSRPGMSI
jgi:hypothetical protein